MIAKLLSNMTIRTLLILIASLTFSTALYGFRLQIIQFRFSDSEESMNMEVNAFQDRASTDPIADDTTVDATLINNFALNRWELLLRHNLSDTFSLKAGYDITADATVDFTLETFDVGHPEAINSIKVVGDLKGIRYNEDANSIWISAKPTSLTPSPKLPNGMEDVLMVYLSYKGNSDSHPGGLRDLQNTVIQSNVCVDDLSDLEDPSSAFLIGAGVRADGLPTTEAEFTYYGRLSFTESTFGGRSFLGADLYVDGYIPSDASSYEYAASIASLEDFSLTSIPEVNQGDNDVVKIIYNFKGPFSLRDLQIGFFDKVWYGSFGSGVGWHYLEWFDFFYLDQENFSNWIFHATLGWLWTWEDSTYDSIFLFSPDMGWGFTTDAIYPSIYLFNFEGEGFWVFYEVGTSNPGRFTAFKPGGAEELLIP